MNEDVPHREDVAKTQFVSVLLPSSKGEPTLLLNTEVCSNRAAFTIYFSRMEQNLTHCAVFMQKDGKRDKAAVDKTFFLRVLKILRIMVPGVFCMEVLSCLRVFGSGKFSQRLITNEGCRKR